MSETDTEGNRQFLVLPLNETVVFPGIRTKLNVDTHCGELLAAGMLSVKQVAAAVGYADQRYFAKRFRRATGRCPRAVRGG